MKEHLALAIKALEQLRGDDLYRAQAAFADCTPAQMAEEYGQSGRTRDEILAEYEAHDARVTAAIAALRRLAEEGRA